MSEKKSPLLDAFSRRYEKMFRQQIERARTCMSEEGFAAFLEQLQEELKEEKEDNE